MYLTAEQLAIANQAILETFEHTSVAWQAIPHWDTGDPGQSRIPAEDVNAPVAGVKVLLSVSEGLDVTLALMTAPTLDSLLGKVVNATVALAKTVDEAVVPLLREGGKVDDPLDYSTADTILDDLIDARSRIENQGFRAPSCLITNTEGIKKLSQLNGGYSILNSLLEAAHINSLHRVELLETPAQLVAGKPVRAILLGRRHRIAHAAATDASPGEEPVDLVVSVPPSLEVVGENGDNKIALSIRIRYALRVKDNGGLVTLAKP